MRKCSIICKIFYKGGKNYEKQTAIIVSVCDVVDRRLWNNKSTADGNI